MSHSLDATDRHSGTIEIRARKFLDDDPKKQRKFLEAAWTKTGGDSSELDYKIDTLCAGLGVEGALGRDGWVALAGGLSLQDPEFDTAGSNIDGQVGYGPYVALEGGWQATPTLEPFARTDLALYLPEFSSTFGIEAGVRIHVVEHGAFFAGWRYMRYNVRDLPDAGVVDQIYLDSSGFVVGMSLSF